MRQLHRIAGLLVLALCALGCGSNDTSGTHSAAAGGERRIIILTNGSSHFWDAACYGMQQAEKGHQLRPGALCPHCGGHAFKRAELKAGVPCPACGKQPRAAA